MPGESVVLSYYGKLNYLLQGARLWKTAQYLTPSGLMKQAVTVCAFPAARYVEQAMGVTGISQAISYSFDLLTIITAPQVYILSKVMDYIANIIGREIIEKFQIKDPNVRDLIMIAARELSLRSGSKLSQKEQVKKAGEKITKILQKAGPLKNAAQVQKKVNDLYEKLFSQVRDDDKPLRKLGETEKSLILDNYRKQLEEERAQLKEQFQKETEEYMDRHTRANPNVDPGWFDPWYRSIFGVTLGTLPFWRGGDDHGCYRDESPEAEQLRESTRKRYWDLNDKFLALDKSNGMTATTAFAKPLTDEIGFFNSSNRSFSPSSLDTNNSSEQSKPSDPKIPTKNDDALDVKELALKLGFDSLGAFYSEMEKLIHNAGAEGVSKLFKALGCGSTFAANLSQEENLNSNEGLRRATIKTLVDVVASVSWQIEVPLKIIGALEDRLLSNYQDIDFVNNDAFHQAAKGSVDYVLNPELVDREVLQESYGMNKAISFLAKLPNNFREHLSNMLIELPEQYQPESPPAHNFRIPH